MNNVFRVLHVVLAITSLYLIGEMASILFHTGLTTALDYYLMFSACMVFGLVFKPQTNG